MKLVHFVVIFSVLLGPQATSSAQTIVGVTADGRTVKCGPGQTFPWIRDLTKTKAPEYPSRERALNHQGAGMFRVVLEPTTGVVVNVTVLRSIGYERLDYAVTSALRQWRVKPRTWKQFDFPVVFEMARDRQDALQKVERARHLGPTFLSQ
jgi:TonB family protein